MMRRLSGSTGMACALSYTQTISTFQAAVNGTRFLAVDLSMPQVRHGQDPDHDPIEMIDAGLFLDDTRVIVGGTALLASLTGFELTPEPATVGPDDSAAVANLRPEWELAGHPAVLAVICVGFVAALISLGFALTQDASAPQLLWRLFCVVATGYAAFVGQRELRTRRRERRSNR